jgi:outer membrane protein with beta-barrel domain
MRRRLIVVLTIIAATLVVPGQAAAADRAGFWFGIGGGYGSASVSCDGCGSSDREGSGAGYVEAGWTLSRHALIGIEGDLWRKDSAEHNATLKLYNISGTLTLYPSSDGGFFIKGGVGASLISIEARAPGTTVSVDLGRGPGVIFGMGYDISVGRVAITPAISVWAGKPGDLTIGTATFARGWKQNVVALTIGLTVP